MTDISAKSEQVENGREAEIALKVVRPFMTSLYVEHQQQALKALASVWPWARRRAASHAERAEAIRKLDQYLAVLISNGQSVEADIAEIRKRESWSPYKRSLMG